MERFLEWFAVVICFPVLAPIGLLALAYRMKRRRLALHPFQALKDGQLLWFSAAISTAGILDVLDAEHHMHSALNFWAIFFLLLFVLASVAAIAITLEDNVPLPANRTARQMIKEVPLIPTSLAICLLSIVACAFAHVRAAAPEPAKEAPSAAAPAASAAPTRHASGSSG